MSDNKEKSLTELKDIVQNQVDKNINHKIESTYNEFMQATTDEDKERLGFKLFKLVGLA